MTKVGYVSKEQFEKTPELKSQYGSYENFMMAQLGTQSAFTFAKKYAMQKAEQTFNEIRSEVDGWYVQKEQKKDEAEERYYAALEQYEAMKSSQDKALSRLNYATNIYGQDSTQYSDALKKYNLSSKTLFGADINLSCARDQFNFANNSAFKAYLSTQLT